MNEKGTGIFCIKPNKLGQSQQKCNRTTLSKNVCIQCTLMSFLLSGPQASTIPNGPILTLDTLTLFYEMLTHLTCPSSFPHWQQHGGPSECRCPYIHVGQAVLSLLILKNEHSNATQAQPLHQISYYNEHFDIITMKIGSGVEAGQHLKGRECF